MVSVEILKQIIREGEEKLEKVKDSKEREVENKLKDEMEEKELATLFYGIRRAGKTTLALRLSQHYSTTYINFEDERLMDLTIEDLTVLADLWRGYDVIILDEVQNVQGWEKLVHRLLGKHKFLITESILKESDYRGALVGRNKSHLIMPFSYREYKKHVKADLLAYIEHGGFPYPSLTNQPELAREYAKDIFYREIAPSTKKAEKLFFYLLDNPGITTTLRKIKHLMSLSEKTLQHYVDLFLRTFVFLEVEKHQAIYRYRKLYPTDNGLSRGSFARKVEAVVAQELYRQGYQPKYYSHNHGEIDFIVGDTAIQVTVELDKNAQREKKILEKWPGRKLLISLRPHEEAILLENFLLSPWDYL
ncbi:MAG: ATP-binding protein [Candidatus Micrarchaeota archaeon]|nr:ATP-binding protein [Candidatus Micrarchaeota archaeon]